MTSEFRSKAVYLIGIASAVAVAVPIYLAVLLNVQSHQAESAYGWVEHTHIVLEAVGEVRNTVRQAKSSAGLNGLVR